MRAAGVIPVVVGHVPRAIEKHLDACKIQVVAESVRAKWQPKPDDLEKCRELGQNVARAVAA